MKRREFIAGLGGAVVAWPFAAGAQQAAMPVVGFLRTTKQDDSAYLVAAFRQGLRESGYVEGQNLIIEYRWAEGQHDRLPALAADLVSRKVAVLVCTGGTHSVLAAKVATATIPIVFTTGGDPVRSGVVTSLSRLGGNVTGFTQFSVSLEAKRLEVLREAVPNVAVIAVLMNPNYPDAEIQLKDLQTAAGAIWKEIHVVKASSESGIDTAFAILAQQRAPCCLRSVLQQPARSTGRTDGAPRDTCDLQLARIRRGRRSDELRNQHYRDVSPSWHLHCPHSQGRDARHPAGPTSHEGRVSDQPQNCQGTRPRGTTIVARPRRRGH